MEYSYPKWTEQEISKLLNQLQRGIEPDVEIIGGKLDLRGIGFPRPVNSETKSFKGHDYLSEEGNLSFKKVKFDNIDFSGSSFSSIHFDRCLFNNVTFGKVKAKNVRFWDCHFKDVDFTKSDMRGSSLNINIGKESGSFRNVRFSECDLRQTEYSFPLFDGCEFIHCNLKEVDFNGSRFSSCSFEGKLDSVAFRGYALNVNSNKLFFKLNPEKFPNPMNQVDFTSAELLGVDFTDGIDLSKCTFPVNENYLLIDDLNKMCAESSKVLPLFFTDEKDRNMALGLIENMYCREEKRDQRMDFMDKPLLSSIYGEPFANTFFEAIRTIK